MEQIALPIAETGRFELESQIVLLNVIAIPIVNGKAIFV